MFLLVNFVLFVGILFYYIRNRNYHQQFLILTMLIAWSAVWFLFPSSPMFDHDRLVGTTRLGLGLFMVITSLVTTYLADSNDR